jgi:excisionase family DNA binding protein
MLPSGAGCILPKKEGERMAREKQGFQFLTVSEVAQLMRVSNMTVYRLIKSGALKAVQVGNRYRVKESDVHQYLDDHYVRAV